MAEENNISSFPVENDDSKRENVIMPGGEVGVETKGGGGLNVNKVQVPYERDDGRKKLKKQTDDRRDELLMLINDLGFFRARRLAKSLAEKYRISFQQIYQDFDWIKGHVKPEDLREVKIDLRIGRSKAYSAALQMLHDAKNGREKKEAIDAIVTSGRHYREELEAWGEKEKIAEKHEIKGIAQVVFNEITKSVEEIRNDRHNTVPETTGTP